MRPPRAVVAASAGLAVTSIACSTILGFEDLSLLVPVDAGPDVTDQDGGACEHRRWPSPPSEDEGGPNIELVFGMSKVRLGADFNLPDGGFVGGVDNGDPLGFDLDLTCTCPGPGSCVSPGAPGASNATCDQTGGRDVTGNRLLGALAAFVPALTEPELQKRIERGRFNYLVRVRNYNGKPNDPSVVVEFFNSTGFVAPSPGALPRFDGTDVWTVHSDSYLTQGVSRYRDLSAYVTDSVLVAANFGVPLPLYLLPQVGQNDNPLVVEIDGAVITGRLVPEGSSFRVVEGSAAGRWSTDAALKSFSYLTEYATGKNLCGDSDFYAAIRDEMCRARDIASNPAKDGQGEPCDAISVSIGFEAVPVGLGESGEFPVVPPNCPPGWNPSCDRP